MRHSWAALAGWWLYRKMGVVPFLCGNTLRPVGRKQYTRAVNCGLLGYGIYWKTKGLFFFFFILLVYILWNTEIFEVLVNKLDTVEKKEFRTWGTESFRDKNFKLRGYVHHNYLKTEIEFLVRPCPKLPLNCFDHSLIEVETIPV